MGKAILDANVDLYEYLLSVSLRETELLKRLREETAKLPQAGMQISPEQGQFMAMVAKLIGARRYLEVGTFTGYSSLVVAEAMGLEGRLVACDVSEEWTSVARRYWKEAGVEDRIELRLGPAVETLDALLKEEGAGRFDMAFIDADKSNYGQYYEQCLKLLRPGGLILLDNMLWGGRVIQSEAQDVDTEAIRALNLKLKDDERIDASLLMVGDGVYLARKR